MSYKLGTDIIQLTVKARLMVAMPSLNKQKPSIMVI